MSPRAGAVRAYVPLTSSSLAALVAAGRLEGPLRAHAVTEALRAEWPDGDEEGWEYAALMAAAATSRTLLTPADRPRRVVLAVDVPAVEPVAGDDPTLVDVAADVPWRTIASAHVDPLDDAPDDDDLAWYATQEIAHLL